MPKQKSEFNRRRRRGWTASTAALTALGAVFATMQRPAFADATTPTPPPVVVVNGTPWVQVSSAAQLEYIDLNQTAAISAGSSITYLNADIELMGNIAITSDWTPLSNFQGTFDGQGYEITGLNVIGSDYSNEGFVGELGPSGMIKHLGVEITVSGNGSYVGGLVGLQEEGSSITDSYARVSVSGGQTSSIGGLVGIESTYATITDSYAFESVTATSSNAAGGLVGDQDSGATITDSYAIGSVSGGSGGANGGLVGYAGGGNITDSYAVGYVGGYIKGGVVGESSGLFTNCYYDDSTFMGLGGGGALDRITGLTDVQMKEQPSYIGWDFTTTWGIDPAVNSGYPYLRANMPVSPAPYITSFDSTRDIRPGTQGGTTSLTLTPKISGDTFDILLYSGSIPVPNYHSVPHAGATPYTSGNNLAATIGENIYVYELNSNGQVEAYIGLFQLTSAMIAVSPLEITTTTVNNGEVSAAYSGTLHASGGDGHYTWSLAIGAPSWLNINSSTGALSGTPTASGLATFTVNVIDGSGGSASKTYTINISPATPLSSDATLSSLTLGQGTLTPGFAASTTSYTASVPYSATSVNVTPTAADINATVTVNGNPAASGSAINVPLNVGSNTITVHLTAQDRSTQKTYTITVTRTSATGGSNNGGGSTSPSLPIVLASRAVDNTGADIKLTNGDTSIDVSIPAGAFSQAEQVTVTGGVTGDLQRYVRVVPGNSVAVVLGVNFSGAAPTKPVTVTITNSRIPASGVVYKLTSSGELVPLTAQVSAGKAVVSFTSDPDFVVLNVMANQRVITLAGHASIVPAVVQSDAGVKTTYMPIWYVMQFLKFMDVSSTWDGHNWHLTTGSTLPLGIVKPGKGSMLMYLNGMLVQNVTGIYATDPSTGKNTTYMPIWYVQQVLAKLGVQSTWNGTTWTVTDKNGQ